MSVVLPAPLGPTIATRLPMSMPRLTFCRPKSSRPAARRAHAPLSQHQGRWRTPGGAEKPGSAGGAPRSARAVLWPCRLPCRALCCAVLCCAVLCCAVLCCAVLCRAVPCRAVPCRAVPCRQPGSPGYLKSASMSCMSGGCSSVGSGKWKDTCSREGWEWVVWVAGGGGSGGGVGAAAAGEVQRVRSGAAACRTSRRQLLPGGSWSAAGQKLAVAGGGGCTHRVVAPLLGR